MTKSGVTPDDFLIYIIYLLLLFSFFQTQLNANDDDERGRSARSVIVRRAYSYACRNICMNTVPEAWNNQHCWSNLFNHTLHVRENCPNWQTNVALLRLLICAPVLRGAGQDRALRRSGFECWVDFKNFYDSYHLNTYVWRIFHYSRRIF